MAPSLSDLGLLYQALGHPARPSAGLAMLVFSGTYGVDHHSRPHRRNLLFHPGRRCHRRPAGHLRAPARLHGRLRLVRHEVLVGSGRRPRGGPPRAAGRGGGLPLPSRGDHGRRAARVAALRRPRRRAGRPRIRRRGRDLRHLRAGPRERPGPPVERLAQALGLGRPREDPRQPGRDPRLSRARGLVEVRGERARRDRRGAAAGRAIRPAPRARPAAAGGPAGRGAGRPHPLAGGRLQGARLPLLAPAPHPDLGRQARGLMPARRAVVLLSGGLDSTTALAVARAEGFDGYALSFDYGQRHDRELESARRVAAALGAKEHLVLRLDLRAIGGSALTGDIPVPKGRSHEAMGSGIPVTYVPARNTIFLSHALAWAEVLESQDIYIGVNALDYSGYPDCRPEYIEAFERMANLATKAGVEGRSRLTIHTPLIRLTKAQIVQRGAELGVDFGLTWSCYEPQPDGRACGLCDSCLLRQKGFAEAGLCDPVPVAR